MCIFQHSTCFTSQRWWNELAYKGSFLPIMTLCIMNYFLIVLATSIRANCVSIDPRMKRPIEAQKRFPAVWSLAYNVRKRRVHVFSLKQPLLPGKNTVCFDDSPMFHIVLDIISHAWLRLLTIKILTFEYHEILRSSHLKWQGFYCSSISMPTIKLLHRSAELLWFL